jgi:16S rRNA (cytosine1402-N4)-methyltransferase
LLLTDPNGTYVDATLGGGGHAAAILGSLGEDGRLLGLDCDPAAVSRVSADPPAPKPRFVALRARFSGMEAALADLGIAQVDGILADLGISSDQLDDPARGLAHAASGPLDMRLDPSLPMSADALLRATDDRGLARLPEEYGELPRAHAAVRGSAALWRSTRRSPRRICAKRCANLPGPTGRAALPGFQVPGSRSTTSWGSWSRSSRSPPGRSGPAGRSASFHHSLEDRLVKTALRPPRPSDPRTPVVDSWIPAHQETLRPSMEECARNPRARSARLRADAARKVPMNFCGAGSGFHALRLHASSQGRGPYLRSSARSRAASESARRPSSSSESGSCSCGSGRPRWRTCLDGGRSPRARGPFARNHVRISRELKEQLGSWPAPT